MNDNEKKIDKKKLSMFQRKTISMVDSIISDMERIQQSKVENGEKRDIALDLQIARCKEARKKIGNRDIPLFALITSGLLVAVISSGSAALIVGGALKLANSVGNTRTTKIFDSATNSLFGSNAPSVLRGGINDLSRKFGDSAGISLHNSGFMLLLAIVALVSTQKFFKQLSEDYIKHQKGKVTDLELFNSYQSGVKERNIIIARLKREKK